MSVVKCVMCDTNLGPQNMKADKQVWPSPESQRKKKYKKHNCNHTFPRIRIHKQRATRCKSLRNIVAGSKQNFHRTKHWRTLPMEGASHNYTRMCMCECVNTGLNGWLSKSLEQASSHCDVKPPAVHYCRSVHWMWLLTYNSNSQQASLH